MFSKKEEKTCLNINTGNNPNNIHNNSAPNLNQKNYMSVLNSHSMSNSQSNIVARSFSDSFSSFTLNKFVFKSKTNTSGNSSEGLLKDINNFVLNEDSSSINNDENKTKIIISNKNDKNIPLLHEDILIKNTANNSNNMEGSLNNNNDYTKNDDKNPETLEEREKKLKKKKDDLAIKKADLIRRIEQFKLEEFTIKKETKDIERLKKVKKDSKKTKKDELAEDKKEKASEEEESEIKEEKKKGDNSNEQDF